MKTQDDVRYSSDAAATTTAEVVRFPFTVVARKTTFDAGLQAAKSVVHKLQQESNALGLGTIETEARQIRCIHEPKGMLVELSASVVLKWRPDIAGFWPRAEGISKCLDIVQRACEVHTKSGSDVAVYTAAGT
jgi:hypothetical protein